MAYRWTFKKQLKIKNQNMTYRWTFEKDPLKLKKTFLSDPQLNLI